ncbi:CsxC family protein [Clostridium rectalis]|uniref:CsxC family protein n=1 Tax=Clostridium rectalis TaxID=2040295 RepID=UPI000F64477B|nr:hypothetical protein [Clostridium rectalis]
MDCNKCFDITPQPNQPCTNTGVTKAGTKVECENFPDKSCGHPGYLLSKIPVVLSEFTVQIDAEANITLEEPAIDIKFIDKNAYLTQCHLIPGTDKLYIEGYIRKNIVYSSKDCAGQNGVSGNLKHSTVNVPFDCVTKVRFFDGFNYNNIFHPNCDTEEISIFDPKCLGKKNTEYNFSNYETLNEKVFCEIENIEIYETDIELDPTPICKAPTEHSFQHIKEKIVIYITLKLLQNRQIYVNGKLKPRRD